VRKIDAARRDGLIVSAISVWEIGVLSAKGRIQLSVPLRGWIENALHAPGIRLTPLDAAAAVESTLLPGEPHGDSADRMLIATARTQNIPIATRDKDILEYGKMGFVRTVAI
jgi:PIN domain nuclease of toxin-antitoxin system